MVVRINDRGPFVRGVSLDLARGAAFALGMRGNATVRIAPVGGGAIADSQDEGGPSQESRTFANNATANDATRFWGSPFERALDL